nr:uncharacterized protein LOC112794328 isoform X2 [Arachis hypogaea]
MQTAPSLLAVAEESSLSREPRGEKLRDSEGGGRGPVTRGARPTAPPCDTAVILTVPPSPLPPRHSPSFMGEQRGRAREQSRRGRFEAELGVQPPCPAVLASPALPPLEPPCYAKLTLLPPKTATEAGVVRCCKLPLPESLPGLPLHGSVTSHL